MALLSDRAGKTSSVVVMPSTLDDPSKSPPGIYRVGVFLACAAVFAFFAALVVAFYWRANDRAYWRGPPLPRLLWVATNPILARGPTFQIARPLWRHGAQPPAPRYCVG